jgi:SEC-C motif-containing protein
MSQCPCKSNKTYQDCCGKYLEGNATPKTPEALMRSRYTAYSLADMDYIKKTMQGKPLLGFNEIEAKQWAMSVLWLGLEVIRSLSKEAQNDAQFVEFVATYLDRGTVKAIHEISQFHCIDEAWFYIDGNQVNDIKNKQIARNESCPCGSNKKFKNCHSKNVK